MLQRVIHKATCPYCKVKFTADYFNLTGKKSYNKHSCDKCTQVIINVTHQCSALNCVDGLLNEFMIKVGYKIHKHDIYNLKKLAKQIVEDSGEKFYWNNF